MEEPTIKKQRTSTPINIQIGKCTRMMLHKSLYCCTDDEFSEFKLFMLKVSTTPNRWRPSTNILRKQCAFFLLGAPIESYEFGQKQDSFVMEKKCMPNLLSRIFSNMEDAYNMAQCNYYENGAVGISPHQDNEKCIDNNYPIISVTFFENKSDVRPFSIYDLNDNKILDIMIGHGDQIIMEDQTEFKHGIEKERPKKYGSRINFTFRVSK